MATADCKGQNKQLINFQLAFVRTMIKYVYEEMMTNDDNLESSLLTSILLKIRSLYKFCYKLHMSAGADPGGGGPGAGAPPDHQK